MVWAGLSTQVIWVDVGRSVVLGGSVVLASVNETRDQRKMGKLRARKLTSRKEERTFLGMWEDHAF